VRATPEQIDLFTAELELCKVKEGEAVVVLSDTVRRQNTHLGAYAEAATRAAQSLGADVFEVAIPPHSKGGAGRSGYGQSAHGSAVGATPLTGMPAAIDALKGADMVVDLMLLLHSPEQLEILDAGTRILLVQEPIDVLRRLFPDADLRKRVEEAEEVLTGAREFKLTSPAGTDCRFAFGKYDRLTVEYGYTDEPGRWDHWPAGLVAAYPDEEGTEGRIVFDRGDILFPFKRYVESPVTLTLEEGFITKIEGGADALLLREYIDSWNDPDGYAAAHIGWGLSSNVIWSSLAMMDPRVVVGMEHRSAAGSVMFSTGPNTDGGGPRNTPAHCDMTMLGCSLSVDGEPVVVDGKLA
jgi:2,5-dihydroxypyridine 5,6-dioxygenase